MPDLIYSFHNFSFQHFFSEKEIALNGEHHFKRGKTYLLTGASGAGKSTILATMKGLIPTHIPGKIKGSFVSHIDPHQSVYLFQNPYSQLVCNTVKEELVFTMENYAFPKEIINKKIEELAHKFEISPLLKRTAHGLSGGECQRLMLASSMATSPAVLLLDEPCAFLDPEARSEFYSYLAQLRGKHTIILIDHHIEEVMNVVDEVISLTNEEDVENQTPDLSLLLPPASSFATLEFLKLKAGEAIAIRGKNGAGKSTFLHHLAETLHPSPSCSLILQNPESHFCFASIEEELSFKQTDHESQLPVLMNWVGLKEKDLKRSPYLLSEGQKRRLSLLLGVMQKKEILLFDEPTFGQDEMNRRKIRDLLLALKQQGKKLVLVSHDEKLIAEVADRSLTMEKGRFL